MMGRLLGIFALALAAVATTLAGSGLAIAPHLERPTMPLYHDHALWLYRLALLSPAPAAEEVQRHAAAFHVRGTPHFAAALPAVAAAGLVLALLVLTTPRLPRPRRRPLTAMPPWRVARPQWIAPIAIGPPRRLTLRPTF